MASHAQNIYVEIKIRGDIDRIWELTQTPELHEQWDLRFSRIEYLPRPDPDQPQRFLYETRIGFGLQIHGEGESVGGRDGAGGERISTLKFWSDDPKSLIRQGSGYWKYIPDQADGGAVRFLTGYDYDVRFGLAGRVIDCLIFRPLIGWATAWSFDRLRLWIERGIAPAISMRMSAANFVARSALAIIWLYEGIIPKLVYRHPDELAILHDAGFSATAAREVLIAIGVVEVGIGLTLIFAWRSRWLLWFTLIAMPLAASSVAIASARFLVAPFNPITLNVGVFALAAVALLLGEGFTLGQPLHSQTENGTTMSSIYQQAMGSDFSRLHPQIQKRFGFGSEDGIGAIGRGVMEKLWHGAFYTLPFLYIGTWRRIMFPEQGQNVPFVIENYAYRDTLGRETITWLRTFQTARPRRFDAYMINSNQRGKIVDYLGTHQHLAVDIDLSVDERGGLRLRSGEQRFYEGPIAFRFPMLFSGIADVCEWFDDTSQKFRIEVSVSNRTWGKLFGYSGWFDVEWKTMTPDQIPSHAKPRREERRE